MNESSGKEFEWQIERKEKERGRFSSRQPSERSERIKFKHIIAEN